MSLKDRVLVTGGAGFIGSQLVRDLVDKKYKVIVMDNLIAGRRENLKEIPCILEVKDIRNQKHCEKILKEYKINYVLHLAAEPFIPKGYQDPEIMFNTNTLGTLRLLLSCSKYPVERFIYYSSSEIYGTAISTPMDEHHSLHPHSIYAVSKLAGEKCAVVLEKEKQIPVVVLRQFNTFGPREAQPYIIPEIISQFTRTGHLKLGNIQAKRDFTYVKDSSSAAISVMESKSYLNGEIFNVGSGKAISILDVVKIISPLMNRPYFAITVDSTRLRPYDVNLLECNASKIEKMVGWKPTYSFEQGMKETIEWFKKSGNKWSWEK